MRWVLEHLRSWFFFGGAVMPCCSCGVCTSISPLCPPSCRVVPRPGCQCCSQYIAMDASGSTVERGFMPAVQCDTYYGLGTTSAPASLLEFCQYVCHPHRPSPAYSPAQAPPACAQCGPGGWQACHRCPSHAPFHILQGHAARTPCPLPPSQPIALSLSELYTKGTAAAA